jgi:squalene cyclase
MTAIKAALEANEFNPDCDTQAVLVEEIQRMAKRIEELEAKDEPVAWMVYTQEGQSAFVTDNPAVIHPSQRALPLYATPQRTWVGLTDEELDDCYDNVEWNTVDWCPDHQQLARAVEAKLREKNT